MSSTHTGDALVETPPSSTTAFARERGPPVSTSVPFPFLLPDVYACVGAFS